MAMNVPTLRDLILAELDARGFDTGNEHARTTEFAEAIATAVIAHIQSSATANVSSGSSSGSWPIT